MSNKTLVAIVSRTDLPRAPEDVCRGCKHFVRLDAQADVILAAGGVPLCFVCATDIETTHPGTFTEQNLAKIPPDSEVEYVRARIG